MKCDMSEKFDRLSLSLAHRQDPNILGINILGTNHRVAAFLR